MHNDAALRKEFAQPLNLLAEVSNSVSYTHLDVYKRQIITMPAGEPVSRLHDRQPVILDPDIYGAWLDPETVSYTHLVL